MKNNLLTYNILHFKNNFNFLKFKKMNAITKRFPIKKSQLSDDQNITKKYLKL